MNILGYSFCKNNGFVPIYPFPLIPISPFLLSYSTAQTLLLHAVETKFQKTLAEFLRIIPLENCFAKIRPLLLILKTGSDLVK